METLASRVVYRNSTDDEVAGLARSGGLVDVPSSAALALFRLHEGGAA